MAKAKLTKTTKAPPSKKTVAKKPAVKQTAKKPIRKDARPCLSSKNTAKKTPVVAKHVSPTKTKKPVTNKVVPVKKAAPIKKAPVVAKHVSPTKTKKATPVKKTAPIKKATPIKKVVPVKKTAPIKKIVPVKKVAPVKKAASIKKVVPVKKATPVKKVTPIKKTPVVAKHVSPTKIVKKAIPVKKAAPVKKVVPVKNTTQKTVIEVKHVLPTQKSTLRLHSATNKNQKSKKITNPFNFTTELDYTLMKETIDKAKASISKATMETGDYSIEQKLTALFSLQLIDSEIDKIRIIRGELPLEVQDLEDEVAGLETRLNRFKDEIQALEKQVLERKSAIVDAKEMIKKYESQQNKVRNNREYESLNKEVEYQTLEIQLQDKRIKEANWQLEQKRKDLAQLKETFEERTEDLEAKKAELNAIIAETEIEEQELLTISNEHKKKIEPRLITSYDKVRENARNGLAVAVVERDACSGCFQKIPPQRQVEIKQHKKILVCEHCGRILVDEDIRKAVLG